MGMSKKATGNIKIFLSRLNDFEIAQSADEKLMRRKKKKNLRRLERQSWVQSLLAFRSAVQCQGLVGTSYMIIIVY